MLLTKGAIIKYIRWGNLFYLKCYPCKFVPNAKFHACERNSNYKDVTHLFLPERHQKQKWQRIYLSGNILIALKTKKLKIFWKNQSLLFGFYPNPSFLGTLSAHVFKVRGGGEGVKPIFFLIGVTYLLDLRHFLKRVGS